MIKVLMVSRSCTHPHDMGNRQRIYRECCQMRALGWQVDFLYWGGKSVGDIEEMEKFFGKEHFHFAHITSLAPKYQLKQIFRRKLDEKVCPDISHFIMIEMNYIIRKLKKKYKQFYGVNGLTSYGCNMHINQRSWSI